MKGQTSSTHHTTSTSALEERLHENLRQHNQGHSSGEATPIDLTFRELRLERE